MARELHEARRHGRLTLYFYQTLASHDKVCETIHSSKCHANGMARELHTNAPLEWYGMSIALALVK